MRAKSVGQRSFWGTTPQLHITIGNQTASQTPSSVNPSEFMNTGHTYPVSDAIRLGHMMGAYPTPCKGCGGKSIGNNVPHSFIDEGTATLMFCDSRKMTKALGVLQ